MDTIIVGYSDSAASKSALRWAIGQATAASAEVLLVYAFSSVLEWELAAAQVNPDPLRHQFDQLLHGEWSQPLRDADVEHRVELLIGRPAEAIMGCARREHAALIVVGMSRRGTLSDLVFGGVARDIGHRALRPVVFVPPD